MKTIKARFKGNKSRLTALTIVLRRFKREIKRNVPDVKELIRNGRRTDVIVQVRLSAEVKVVRFLFTE